MNMLPGSFASRHLVYPIYRVRSESIQRQQPSRMHGKELQLQTDAWLAAREVALAVPSIDYIGLHGEHFIVVRHNHGRHQSGASDSAANGDEVCVEIKELPIRRRLDCGKGVDLGSDDAIWMERKDVLIDYEMSGPGSYILSSIRWM